MPKPFKSKTVTVTERTGVLHVEAPGCIVNIRPGLIDAEGRSVTSVAIQADQYADERWNMPDLDNAHSFNVRVVQIKKRGEDVHIQE